MLKRLLSTLGAGTALLCASAAIAGAPMVALAVPEPVAAERAAAEGAAAASPAPNAAAPASPAPAATSDAGGAQIASLGTVAVLGADQKPLDLEGAWVSGGVAAVTTPGLTVTCTVSDELAPQVTSLRLRVGRVDIPAQPVPDDAAGAAGTASTARSFTFDLSATSCKTERIALDKAIVRAFGSSGKELASVRLSELPPFKDASITGLLFIDAADETNRPSAAVLLDGKPTAQDTLCTNAASVAVSFSITDPLFESLRDSAWFDAHAIGCTLDGAPATLDPASFSKVRGAKRQYACGPVATWEAEGRHTASLAYAGAQLAAEQGAPLALSATTAASVVIDRTKPAAASASVKGGYDADAEVAQIPAAGDKPAYNVLFGGARTMVLALRDEPAAEGVEASGVAGYTVTLKRHGKVDGTGSAATETITERDAPVAKGGTVEIALDDAGTYLLDECTVTVRDRAGNASDPVSLRSLAGAISFDRIAVDASDEPAPNEGFGIEVSSANATGSDRYYWDDTVQVTLWGGGWRFNLFRHTPAFKRCVQATFTSWKGEQVVADRASQPTFTENPATGRYEAVLTLPRDADGGASDGTYRVSFRGSSFSASASRTFMVDTTAPVVTDAYVDAAPDPARDIVQLDGLGRLAVGGTRTLHVRVQDLQPRAAGDAAADVAGANEDNTAGLDERVLRAGIGRLLDLNGLRAPDELRTLSADERGWVEIPLQSEGVYLLSDLALTLPDNAGNGRDGGRAAHDAAAWGVDGILVDTDETTPTVSLTVTDAAGTPASKDAHYHRGAVQVVAQVEDKWFAARRALPGSDGLLSANTLQQPGEATAAPLPALALADFANVPGSYVWSAAYELSRAQELADALPLEGEYRLAFEYRAVCGTAHPAAPAAFGIDYTGPSFGTLELSAEEPYRWGWVFASEPERISLTVRDNLSGVQPATAVLSTAGGAEPSLAFEAGPSVREGTFRLELARDAQRLLFDGTHVGVEDAAGNPSDSGSFGERAGADLPKDAVGICMDLSAPVLTMAFDNNDAANGMYYKAARTATVTLVEPSFDLIRSFDGRRTVITVERDGSVSQVRAQDFENPSGDGATWVATVACDTDADWAVSASFEDVAQRLAQVPREAFVVDTVAPRIGVAFDNNEAAGGMYYKAPRTASITVDDRNFAPQLAQVSPWAKDAAGNAAGAPAVAAWREDEPRAAWSTSVAFAQELHYGLSVQAQDLAGNVAEAVEEPEFVVDLTAPAVSIGGVDNHTAYADAVRPTVSFSDTNFDPLMATYELVGAAQGPVYLPCSEQEQAGGKAVSYEDFEHVLKNDDVYTLTARVADRAGNTAEQAVTFSVNRFGSTYYFADPQSAVAGAYLSEPRDIDIVEVNVSGLAATQTHAEVVHDSRTQVLSCGVDYQVADGASGAWSATTYRFGRQLFEQDGFYRILLTSHDRAGNLSQNTMDGKDATREHPFDVAFAVDGCAPVANLAGVGSRGVYLDPHMQVLVDAHDNVELDRAVLSVDGKTVGTWSAADLAGGAPAQRLPADAQPHTYELAVTDCAGNTTVARYEDVVVTGDWISFILNTPRLLFGSVGALIALTAALAGATWALVRRHRRLRALRERLNP